MIQPLFININGRYLNVAHIIEICVQRDKVSVITSEQISEGVGEVDWVATSAQISYRTGTPEAEALIAWANRNAETLV